MHKTVHIIMIVLAVLAVVALGYGVFTEWKKNEKYCSSSSEEDEAVARKKTLINRACCPHYGQCGSHYAHVPWGMTYDGRYVPLA